MQLGLTAGQAASVVVSTLGIYLAFLVLIRLVGQRALATMSSVDLAAAMALGAVMGRAVLGFTPDLLAGVLALCTLFGLQVAFGLLRRNPRMGRLLGNAPLLLMADGAVVRENLRRARMGEGELRQRLRLSGICRYEDVAAMVLEPTGAISVLRRGDAITPDLLADVRGRELLAAPAAHERAGGR